MKLDIKIDVKQGYRVLGVVLPEKLSTRRLNDALNTFLIDVGWSKQDIDEYFNNKHPGEE